MIRTISISISISLWLLLGACAARPAGPADPVVAAPVVVAESITIASKILGEVRRINVYTPPGYKEGERRYPVLYLLDGGVAEDFSRITGIVQAALADGSMRPMIVVGIENTQRRRDLTGPTRSAKDRAIAPQVGGSALFRRFLGEELMPAIRREYRALAQGAVLGESLAGLFVLETFLQAPDMFDTYIAIDPSLWWDEASLERGVSERMRSFGARRKTLFMATANAKETRASAQVIARALREAAAPGLRWMYVPMPEERHETILPGAALRAFRAVLGPA